MAQEGHSPVLVFDSPVMVLHSLVLVFTQSSFNFYRVNNNNKFIQYYHFVQVLPIKITIKKSSFNFYTVQFYFFTQSSFIFTRSIHSPVLFSV